jgi:hypothetical protein
VNAKEIIFCLQRERKWTLIEVAQVLTTIVLNSCVAVPTNPSLLYISCLQTTKLMFLSPWLL